MDEAIFLWLNQWNGDPGIFDSALRFSQLFHIKSVPFMLVVWALWFWCDTARGATDMRNRLIALLLCTVPIISVTRAIANYMPFVVRPMHTEGLEVKLHTGQNVLALDGWNSMPSDHASLFFALGLGLFMVHKGFGMLLLLWAAVVVSLPRIVMGLHWPSDIIAGAALGMLTILVSMRPALWIVERTPLVRVFETRKAIGYPLLFLATFEIASMFELIRYLVTAIVE